RPRIELMPATEEIVHEGAADGVAIVALDRRCRLKRIYAHDPLPMTFTRVKQDLRAGWEQWSAAFAAESGRVRLAARRCVRGPVHWAGHRHRWSIAGAECARQRGSACPSPPATSLGRAAFPRRAKCSRSSACPP